MIHEYAVVHLTTAFSLSPRSTKLGAFWRANAQLAPGMQDCTAQTSPQLWIDKQREYLLCGSHGLLAPPILGTLYRKQIAQGAEAGKQVKEQTVQKQTLHCHVHANLCSANIKPSAQLP